MGQTDRLREQQTGQTDREEEEPIGHRQRKGQDRQTDREGGTDRTD
jgi:hypothetical protein